MQHVLLGGDLGAGEGRCVGGEGSTSKRRAKEAELLAQVERLLGETVEETKGCEQSDSSEGDTTLRERAE